MREVKHTICVQSLILFGLLITEWDHIQAFFVLHEHIYQASSIEKDTKKMKAARAKKPKPKPVKAYPRLHQALPDQVNCTHKSDGRGSWRSFGIKLPEDFINA